MVKNKLPDGETPDPRYSVVRVRRPTAYFKRPAPYAEVFSHYRAAAHHYEDQIKNFKIEINEGAGLAVQEHRIACENSFAYENEPLKITLEVDLHTLRAKEAKLKVKESLFYYSGAHAVNYIEYITGFGDGDPVIKRIVKAVLNRE